jgi:hypothetical protein
LAKQHPDAWGMAEIFGTQQNFDNYQIFALLRQHGKTAGRTHRIVLMGYGLFRDDVAQAHALMTELGVLHIYSNQQFSKHAWDPGWIAEAVQSLAGSG